MTEGSASSPVVLEAGVPVAVIGVEHHQEWLERYPVAYGEQWPVVVELGWCVIGWGEHRGLCAIEVKLDGQRVGELGYEVSRRYADVLGSVIGSGRTPCARAVIRHAGRGLEVVLHLPHDPSAFAARPKHHSRRPLWIAGAAAVALFVIIGSIVDQQPANKPAALLTTSAPAPTTAEPTTTTTTTTTPTTTTTTPTTVAAPVPPPEPQPSPEPVPAPIPEPSPAPNPVPPPPPSPVAQQPAPKCHPSYDPCVPIADDVDCAGGKGDGPEFVSGPIKVIGPDEYKLDSDKDGIGCE
ncbi:MAG: hypothetical protein HOV94_01420 [Saccharothrix sp.]|nr:hypothetical protein [Saccharothrix sp.]